MSKQPTLNQILEAMNLTTRPSGKMYRKNVISDDGAVVLEHVTAHEVWAWLGRGELWQSGDSLELAIRALRHELARVEARIIEASEYGLDTTGLEDRAERLGKQARAMDKAMKPIREEEKLQRLKAELAVLEAEARAQDIRGSYARGYEHGLLGMGADVEEGDLEWLRNQGHNEEAEEAAAYLHGFEQGDLVAQVEPVARVEALERLGRAWDQQPDSHPGKEAALDEIGEHLQIARAGLREEFPALLAG